MSPVMGQTYGSNYVWSMWCDNGTASTTQTVWVNWCDQTTMSSATTIYSSQDIWGYWNQTAGSSPLLNSISNPAPRVYTEEEKTESRERLERQQREAAERAAKQNAIRAKAKELLQEILDEEQAAEYAEKGVFHVHTANGERTYRLQPGYPPRRVKAKDGKIYSYCIHPREQFPVEDTTAALKLLIEADEAEFLRIANASFIGNVPVPA